MTATLWLLRHGATEWSVDGRHTGNTDIPLTATGRHNAEALRPWVAGVPFALVLSSPMQRARDTAALAGLTDVTVEPELHEWAYGEYEGITTTAIHEERPDWYLWRDGCPEGELPADVAARVDRVLDRCAEVADAAADDVDLALVAHGHVLRALAARWLDQPVQLGGHLALSAGSLSLLGHERQVPVLQRWNTTP